MIEIWRHTQASISLEAVILPANELQLTEINYGGKVDVTPTTTTRNEISGFQIKDCRGGSTEAAPPNAQFMLCSFCQEQVTCLTAQWEKNNLGKEFLIFTISIKSNSS